MDFVLVNVRFVIADQIINYAFTSNSPISIVNEVHQKFQQPGHNDPVVSVSLEHNVLNLIVRNGWFLEDRIPQKAVYRSESWEYWRDDQKNHYFIVRDLEQPLAAIITSDFQDGEVIGYSNALRNIDRYIFESLEIRIFSAWLSSFGDLILHASAVAVDNTGYCFIGESGAGKSTLVSILGANRDATILGEDQVILRYIEGRFWIFGTPWHQDPEKCSPLGVPLQKVFFLNRELSPGVKQIKPADGVARVLRTAFVPYYLNENMPGILERLSLLAEQIPFYSLSYRLGSDPFPLLYKHRN